MPTHSLKDGRQLVNLYMEKATIAKLDEIVTATGHNRSWIVEQMLNQVAVPKPVKVEFYGQNNQS